MPASEWRPLIDELRKEHRIEFDRGLTDEEATDTEERFGFRFPPDLRAFLQTGLPRGDQFPDWRSGEASVLRDWLDLPRQGLLFDVEHNEFWLPEWGPRPASLDEALRIASDLVAAAPKLIPIFAHRMIPDEPHLTGNPVFSAHQTDIIYYGFDLTDYLRHEFDLDRGPWQGVRPIRFWAIDRFQEVRWGVEADAFDENKKPPQ